MPHLSNDQIRRIILETLYNDALENPTSLGVNRDTMKKILQVDESIIDFNIRYLKEKGLIDFITHLGVPWSFARITAFGIDVVENKERYREQFPFIQAIIQEIRGNVYGQVVQAVNSEVIFSQQVNDAFYQAYQILQNKTDIQPKLREEIKNKLQVLEEELKTEEPNLGKIQEIWKWLKKNASWIAPTLTHIVLEGAKIALGK
ncbi:MAG: hypothetical protein QXU45_03455 [Candidatus Bathyarchaeia archaeon]